MLDRLKEACLRVHYGHEPARLRMQGERELRRLPPDERADVETNGWVDRYWKLPPDAWAKAVDLRLEGRALVEEPEIAEIVALGELLYYLDLFASEIVDVESAENRKDEAAQRWAEYEERQARFWSDHAPKEPKPPPPSPPLAPQEAAAVAEELQKITKSLRGEIQAPSKRFARIDEQIRQAAEAISPKPPALGKPWDAWIAALPEEDRAEGFHACDLWREMIDLRNRLRHAVEERATLTGVIGDEARRVTDVRMFALRGKIKVCEEAYRQFAEPFFQKHGRPPLIGVDPEAARKTRIHVAYDGLHRGFGDGPLKLEDDPQWEAWLKKIPKKHRSKALRVRVLYDDLEVLRLRLLAEIALVRQGDPDARNRIDVMKPELARADQEYRRLAEPFFAKHGKPDLTDRGTRSEESRS